jgi:hypothetical protein
MIAVDKLWPLLIALRKTLIAWAGHSTPIG